MHHVRTDKLNGHCVARVNFKFGGRIGKLPRFNSKDPLLRHNGLAVAQILQPVQPLQGGEETNEIAWDYGILEGPYLE